MAIDGILLGFLKNEIAQVAVGAKVDKIYLPTKYEIVLSLRTRTATEKLFISASGNSPRINFTSYSPENPQKPPMLCMLLRKQLVGAFITDIRQAGLDRILFIDFDATDEIGDRVKRTLVVEIMAQYSNIILLDGNNTIIDSIKRVDSSKSSFREVLPGREYKLPPAQDKLDITKVSSAEAVQRIKQASAKKLSAAILGALSGFSPLLSKEIAYRVALGDINVEDMNTPQLGRLEHEIALLSESITENKPQPCYLTDENDELLEFSFMPLTLYANAAKINRKDTLSEILDIFYFEKERLQRAKSRAEDLFRLVSMLIERTAKKINIQREELSQSENREEKRIFAELINANLYSLSKGATEYVLQDYYNDYAEVKIPVLAHLTPSQNSQRYYKEYRKAQTAQKILSQQIESGSRDLDYLMSVQDELYRAEGERELTEIRLELSESGFIKSKTGTKNKKNAPLEPLHFVSPDGFNVYVGRNNLQNDTLSFKKAHKDDIWFHSKKAPGSHVILEAKGSSPTPAAMEYAAGVAAYFSSIKERGSVEVDYTQVKNLKKPPAARPGFVIYHVYNTMYVKAIKPEAPVKE